MNRPLLENKTALVTGGAAGIGEAIARAFGDEGATVFVLDLNEEGAASVADGIRRAGGSAFSFRVDVRRREDVQAAVDHALQRVPRIDILVNNAGIYPRKTFIEMSEQDWDDVQQTNLKGVFYCTKAVMPHMIARGAGKIINISSVTFFTGLANLTHYVSAKGGVIGFTRSLAREVGPHNVYVNCITPGAIEVETEKLVATPEQIAEIVAQQSLKRRLQPLDIARACLFLASDLGSGLTGQVINVDGGLIMH